MCVRLDFQSNIESIKGSRFVPSNMFCSKTWLSSNISYKRGSIDTRIFPASLSLWNLNQNEVQVFAVFSNALSTEYCRIATSITFRMISAYCTRRMELRVCNVIVPFMTSSTTKWSPVCICIEKKCLLRIAVCFNSNIIRTVDTNLSSFVNIVATAWLFWKRWGRVLKACFVVCASLDSVSHHCGVMLCHRIEPHLAIESLARQIRSHVDLQAEMLALNFSSGAISVKSNSNINSSVCKS